MSLFLFSLGRWEMHLDKQAEKFQQAASFAFLLFLSFLSSSAVQGAGCWYLLYLEGRESLNKET